jgi:hypothetical protein
MVGEIAAMYVGAEILSSVSAEALSVALPVEVLPARIARLMSPGKYGDSSQLIPLVRCIRVAAVSTKG